MDVNSLKHSKVEVESKLESWSPSNIVRDSSESKQATVKDQNLKDLSLKSIGDQNIKSGRPIWASMSICWGKNVQVKWPFWWRAEHDQN